MTPKVSPVCLSYIIREGWIVHLKVIINMHRHIDIFSEFFCQPLASMQTRLIASYLHKIIPPDQLYKIGVAKNRSNPEFDHHISICSKKLWDRSPSEQRKVLIMAEVYGWKTTIRDLNRVIEKHIGRRMLTNERESMRVYFRTGKSKDKLGELTDTIREPARAEWQPGYVVNSTHSYLGPQDQPAKNAQFLVPQTSEWTPGKGEICMTQRCVICNEPYDPSKHRQPFQGKKKWCCSSQCSNRYSDNELLIDEIIKQVGYGIQESLLYSLCSEASKYWNENRVGRQIRVLLETGRIEREKNGSGDVNISYLFLANTPMTEKNQIMNPDTNQTKETNVMGLPKGNIPWNKGKQSTGSGKITKQSAVVSYPKDSSYLGPQDQPSQLSQPPNGISQSTQSTQSTSPLANIDAMLDNMDMDVLALYAEARKKTKELARDCDDIKDSIQDLQTTLAAKEEELSKALDDLVDLKSMVMKEMAV